MSKIFCSLIITQSGCNPKTSMENLKQILVVSMVFTHCFQHSLKKSDTWLTIEASGKGQRAWKCEIIQVKALKTWIKGDILQDTIKQKVSTVLTKFQQIKGRLVHMESRSKHKRYNYNVLITVKSAKFPTRVIFYLLWMKLQLVNPNCTQFNG